MLPWRLQRQVMGVLLVVTALFGAFFGSFQKEGRVRFFVTIQEGNVSHGIQQKTSELEESAADIRRRLKKTKWTELVETAEDADVELRVLGRRTDPQSGFLLDYAIDAGAYKTEDTFEFLGESFDTGGIRSSSGSTLNSSAGRENLRWEELHKRFAASLEDFAEQNYDRIVSQRRKPGQ